MCIKWSPLTVSWTPTPSISSLAQSRSRLALIPMSATPSPSVSPDTLVSDAVPTTSPQVPADQVESPESSALWNSLLHTIAHPNAVCRSLVETLAPQNNPRPLRGVMSDVADYWVKGSGEPIAFRFPAKINRAGQFTKFGPYFNLPNQGVRSPGYMFLSCLQTSVSLTLPHSGEPEHNSSSGYSARKIKTNAHRMQSSVPMQR